MGAISGPRVIKHLSILICTWFVVCGTLLLLGVDSVRGQTTTCFGKGQSDSTVCSSHGFCVTQDYCVCRPGFRGESCAESNTGFGFSAGLNVDGQLGNTFTASQSSLIRIPGWFSLYSLASVSAGEGYSLALTTTGKVYAWGAGTYGQLGLGDKSPRYEPTLIQGVLSSVSVKAIAACAYHSIALASNGELYTWGTNVVGANKGLLGQNHLDSVVLTSPTKVTMSPYPDFISVKCGRYHSMALTSAKKLYVWGSNEENQLGSAQTKNAIRLPTLHTPLQYLLVTSFDAGEVHSVISDDQGKVYTWGLGTNGQTGLLDENTLDIIQSQAAPLQVTRGSIATDKFIVSVAASSFSTYALCSDGTVHAWGLNTNYQLGDNTVTQRPIPVHITTLSDATALFGGSMTTTMFALDNQNKLYAWGKNTNGAFGTGTTTAGQTPTPIPDPYPGATTIQVSPGRDFALSVISGTTCFAVMSGDPNVCTSHGNCTANDVCECQTGFTGHDCSLPFCYGKISSDLMVCSGRGQCLTIDMCVCYPGYRGSECEEEIRGVLYGSGDDSSGQLGDTNNGPGIFQYATIVSYGFFQRQISMFYAGYENSLVISNGQLFGVGNNDNVQLGSTGTPVTEPRPISTGSLSGRQVVSACSGFGYSLALDGSGSVHAMGLNTQGQLGLGDTTPRNEPTQIGGILSSQRIVQISCGYSHAAALSLNGTVFIWGDNAKSQIGNGKTGSIVSSPYQLYISGVLYTRRVSMVVCGVTHTMALVSDGVIYSWGTGAYGQLGLGGTTTTNVVLPARITAATLSPPKTVIMISSTGYSSYAVTSDGVGYAWGSGAQGQIGNGQWTDKNTPTAITGIPSSEPLVFISGGSSSTTDTSSHAIALTSNGTAWTWGSNAYGQLSDRTSSNRNTPVRYNTIYPLRTVKAVSAGYSHTLITYDAKDSCYGVYRDEPHVCTYHGECDSFNHCSCFDGYTGFDCSQFQCFAIQRSASNVCNSRGKCIATDTCVCDHGYTGAQCELQQFGVVYAVGKQDVFQLGDDGMVSSRIAVPTTGLLLESFVTEFEAGYDYSIALGRDRNVYTWGRNQYATIGDEGTGTRRKPYRAYPNGDAISVCNGGYHAMVLNAGGKIFTWGSTRDKESEDCSCWGCGSYYCNYGGLGRITERTTTIDGKVGPVQGGLKDLVVRDIACGSVHSVVATNSGKVWSFGANYFSRNYGPTGRYGGVGAGYDKTYPTWTYIYVPYNVLGIIKFKNIIQVAAGDYHTLALGENGEVYSWGKNDRGQLGDSSTVDKATPTIVAGALTRKTVVFVAAGVSSSFAVTSEGEVYSWGLGSNGQLGHGTTTDQNLPKLITGLSGVKIVHISASKINNYVIAVASNGTAYSWGVNTQGQLGDETTTARSSPNPVINRSSVNKIVSASAGSEHSLFLYNGTFCFGKLSDDPYVCHRRGICTQTDTCECHTGYLGAECEVSQCFGVMSNENSVCSGHGACVALDGCSCHPAYTGVQCETEVFGLTFTTGNNDWYQLGDDGYDKQMYLVQTSYPLSNGEYVKLISAGNKASLVITRSGKLFTWGSGDYAQIGDGSSNVNRNRPVHILPVKTFRHACMGSTYGIAVDSQGAVWAWGTSMLTTIANPLLPTRTCSCVGAYCTRPRCPPASGKASSCGCNPSTEEPERTGVLGEQTRYYTLSPIPVTAVGFPSISSVSCGRYHALALGVDGSVWGWGRNDQGQLGLIPTTPPVGSADGIQPPQRIGANREYGGILGTRKIVAISAGLQHSLALGEHGEVYVWGDASKGQLGDGTTTPPKYNPRHVIRTILSESIVAIAGGGSSSFALSDNGTVYSWGDNSKGALGISSTPPSTLTIPYGLTTVTDITRIAASGLDNFALLLSNNGTAYGMGASTTGSLFGDGSSRSTTYPSPVLNEYQTRQFVAVSAGFDHSIFLFNDTYCFGVLADDALVCSSHGTCTGVDTCECLPGYTSLNCSIPVCFEILANESSVCSGHGSCLLPNICQCMPGYVGDECQYQDQRFLFASGDNTYSELGDGFFMDRSIPKQSSILGRKLFHFMSAGDRYSIAVNFHTGAYAWGLNEQGQLGDGSTINRYYPRRVLEHIDVVKLRTCARHSLALDSNGAVWSWGVNTYGQLGTGNTVNSVIPTLISGFTDIVLVDIACGLDHSMALSSNGSVYTWGRNNNGQLGDGTTVDKSKPTRVGHNFNLVKIVLIAAGESHSMALSDDGSLFVWGNNANGQLGDGKTQSRVVPFKVTSLRGHILQLQPIVYIGASSSSSFVILANTTLLSWGRGTEGQLGINSTTNTRSYPIVTPFSAEYPITMISPSTSGHFVVSLTSNGTAYAWGQNTKGQLGDGSTVNRLLPTLVQNSIAQRYVTGVSSGLSHTLYLYSGTACFGILFDDPTVCSWHGNCTQQDTCECEEGYAGTDCSIPVCFGLNANESSVCSGHGSCISLDTCVCHQGYYDDDCRDNGYGYLFSSGDDRRSQLGNRNIGIQASIYQARLFIGKLFHFIVSSYDYTLAKAIDGTVYGFGDNFYGQLGDGTWNNTRGLPVQIPLGPTNDIVGLCGGVAHAMALGANGTVWAWGSNYYGQIGNNGTKAHNIYLTPTQVTTLTDEHVVAISCGAYHSMALDSNGFVYTWGINSNGELGDDSTTSRSFPVRVGSLLDDRKIVSISAGYSHSMALGSDGTVYTWGKNSKGQLGDSTTVNKIVPVQVSGLLFGVPVKSISAGQEFCSVLTFDNKVYTWGDNSAGQLGDMTTVNRVQPVIAKGISANESIVSISAGGRYVLAMNRNRTVLSWGENLYGQLGNGVSNVTKVTNPVSIVNPYQHTYVTAIHAGSTHSMYLHNGITCFGKFVEDPSVCSTKGNCTAQDHCVCEPYYNADDCSTFFCFDLNATDALVCSGNGYCVAADSCICKPGYSGLQCENEISGFVFTLGNNEKGQFGDTYTISRTVPTEVAGLLRGVKVVSIASGIDFTIAVTVSGTVYGWGANDLGQLGDTDLIRYTPTPVQGLAHNMKYVCAGSKHVAVLDHDGHVFTWGANNRGQLGNGFVSMTATKVPGQVRGIIEYEPIISVVCGEEFTLAMNERGTVFGWGENRFGQLGDGTNSVKTTPVKTGVGVLDEIPLAGVYAGYSHTLAIGPFGVLYAWGDNSAAQIGDGTTNNQYSPIPIFGALKGKIVIAASGSRENSYVATIDEKYYSWGGNFYGQIGDNSSNIQYKATPQRIKIVKTESPIRSLYGGQMNAFALTAQGDAFAWGSNSFGQLGDGSLSQQNVPVVVVNQYHDRVIAHIAPGEKHTAFLYNATSCFGFLSDDENVCSSRGVCISDDVCLCREGFKNYDCSLVMCNDRNSSDPLVCSGHGTCLPNDTCVCHDMWTGFDCEHSPFGYVFAAGQGDNGQLGDGKRTSSSLMVKSRAPTIDRKPTRFVSAGLSFSLSILTSEELYTFGLNDQGQLGGVMTDYPIALSLSSPNHTLRAVGVGASFVIAVMSNYTVYGWGSNAGGQLALGTKGQVYKTPLLIPSLSNYQLEFVSCGITHCLGSTSDGMTLSWGSNPNGELGDGTRDTAKTLYLPYRVLSILEIKKSAMVFAGHYHSLALSIDGVLYSWGDNTKGQLGSNSTSVAPRLLPGVVIGLEHEIVVSITGGEFFSCALCKSYKVYCWGDNTDGQLGDGTKVQKLVPTLVSALSSESIVQIRAGKSHVLARSASGVVYSWGQNSVGQLGLGLNPSTHPSVLVPTIVGRNFTSRYSEFIGVGSAHSLILFNGTTCFNVLQDDPDVCSGNGTCLDWDTCECLPGFSGRNCEFTSCSGINATSPTVCSSHGVCKYLNTCVCWEGQYVGNECQYEACYGLGSNDPKVCSGFGKCLAPNNCTCDPGYVGNNCQYVVCHGRNTSDSRVCSGAGICYTPDNCLCFNSPAPGYTGGNCSAARCYSRFVDRLTGYESILQYPESTSNLTVDLSRVCSGNGYCNVPNKCTCKTGYTDQYCSTPICFNITATNATVCNFGKNGTCVAYNNCTCLTRFDESGWCVPLQCFGKNATTDPSACNNHLARGNCLNVDLCACLRGYGGLECEQNVCNGILEYNTSHVCHGRGACDQPDQCTCHLGFNGTDCQYINCFGKLDVELSVCSGHGECIGPDTCECHHGYAGSKCELFICYGQLSNVSSVCSTFGKCVAPDTCECKYGYSGLECFYPSCFEVNSTESDVCSTHGVCYKPDKCNCTTGYVGRDCSIPTCSGIWGTNQSVCSRNGFCSLPDVCDCVPNRAGPNCELNVCFGLNETDENVCNGHGACVNPNQCKCTDEYTGFDCSAPYCFGIASSSSQVCSGYGICDAPNHCVCGDGRTGAMCEYNICFSFNETDAPNVCSGHGYCHAPDRCNCTEGWSSKDCSEPVCWGKVATETAVCSGNGKCIGPDHCECREGRTGNNCQLNICYGYNESDPLVCSSNGKCLSPDTCYCVPGRTGDNCELNVCFGLNETDSVVCSGHGQCVSPNKCHCREEHYGWDCSSPVCFGIASTNHLVCSMNGQCVLPDKCVCGTGRTGVNCELNVCSGRNQSDPMVCSGHGTCDSPNTCNCVPGYTGNDCQYPICFGKVSTDSIVCSKSGSCVAPDQCVCHNGKTGLLCQLNICFHVNESDPHVCNGHGICHAPDHCQCNSNYTDFNCSTRVCPAGYVGTNCEIVICAGIYSNESGVCNGHGVCVSPDSCQCSDSYTGSNCEALQDQCSGNFLLVTVIEHGMQNISLIDFACGKVAFTFTVPRSSQVIYHPLLKKYLLFRDTGLYAVDSAGRTNPEFLRPLPFDMTSSAIYRVDGDDSSSLLHVVTYGDQDVTLHQLSLSRQSDDKVIIDRKCRSVSLYRDSRFITRDSLGNYFVIGQYDGGEVSIIQIHPSGVFSVVAQLPNLGDNVHAMAYIGRRLYLATRSRFYFLLSTGMLAPEMDLLNGFITAHKMEADLNVYFNDPRSQYVMWSRRDRAIANTYMMYPPSLRGKTFQIIGDFRPQISRIDPPYMSTKNMKDIVSVNGQFLQIGDFSTVTLYNLEREFQVEMKLQDCGSFERDGDVCFSPNFEWDVTMGEIELRLQINLLGTAFTTSLGGSDDGSSSSTSISSSGITFTTYVPVVTRIYPTSASSGDTVQVFAPYYNPSANVSCVFRWNSTNTLLPMDNGQRSESIFTSQPSAILRKEIHCLVPELKGLKLDGIVLVSASMDGEMYASKYVPAFFHNIRPEKQVLYDTFDDEHSFTDQFDISNNAQFQWIAYQEQSSRSLIQYSSTLSPEKPSSRITLHKTLSKTDLHVSVGFVLPADGMGNLLEIVLTSHRAATTTSFVSGAIARSQSSPKSVTSLTIGYNIGGVTGSVQVSCEQGAALVSDQPYLLRLALVRPEIERMNENLEAFNEMLKHNGSRALPDEPWRIDLTVQQPDHTPRCHLSTVPPVTAIQFNDSIIDSVIQVGQSLLLRDDTSTPRTLTVLLDRIWVGCQFEQYCNNTIIPKEWEQVANIASYGKSVVVALSSSLGLLFLLLFLLVIIPIALFIVWRYMRNIKKKEERAKLDAWKFEFVLNKDASSLDDESAFSSVARRMYKIDSNEEQKNAPTNFFKRRSNQLVTTMEYELSDLSESSTSSDVPFM